MTNLYLGLARGPIDHEASSIINAIANEAITMGDLVQLDVSGPPTNELLPRVEVADSAQGSDSSYGIVVGGDADGVYGTGAAAAADINRAATAAGEAVVVVTQGRCLARVNGSITIGDDLTQDATAGALEPAGAGDSVFAKALQTSSGADIAAVDVQRGQNPA